MTTPVRALIAGLLALCFVLPVKARAQEDMQAMTMLDRRLEQAEATISAARATASSCAPRDLCVDQSCGIEALQLAQMRDLQAILIDVARVLIDHQTILEASLIDGIENNDRAAAALEAARIAAAMTRSTDQTLGATIEVIGIFNTALDMKANGASGLDLMIKVNEMAKDIQSLTNRLILTWTELDEQVESVKYVPNLAKDEARAFLNLKSLVEDNLIDGARATLEAAVAEDPGLAEFVKAHSSDIVDATGALATFKDLAGVNGELTSFLTNLRTEGPKAALSKTSAAYRNAIAKTMGTTSDALSKASPEDLRAARDQMALAATLIAARYVKANISEPALNEFRDRIQDLRNQHAKAGQVYLKRVPELEAQTARLRRVEALIEAARQVEIALEPCALDRCAAQVPQLSLITLPALSRRPETGLIEVTSETNRLSGLISNVVTRTSSGAGSTNPFYSSFQPSCAECVEAAATLAPLLARVDMLRTQTQHSLPRSEAPEILRIDRTLLLDRAEELSREYASRTTGHTLNTFTELTDDAQQALVEIAAETRRATTAARGLSRRIRLAEDLAAHRVRLRPADAWTVATNAAETAKQAYFDCQRTCERPASEAAAEKAIDDYRKQQCDVQQVHLYDADDLFEGLRCAAGVTRYIGEPPLDGALRFYDVDRAKVIPPFAEGDPITLCAELSGQDVAIRRDAEDRFIAFAVREDRPLLPFANGYIAPFMAEAADNLVEGGIDPATVEGGSAQASAPPKLDMPVLDEDAFVDLPPPPVLEITPPF